jgi:flagellar motor protein MotB
MAESWVHRQDTERFIKDSLNNDDKQLMVDVVHQVLDGQATTGGKAQFRDVLSRLEQKGIAKDELCGVLFRAGVDRSEINKYPSKEDFLTAWFLPPYGPTHHAYSHKGYDYDYSKDPDTKDYWSSIEVQQSWLLKKHILEKTVKTVYGISDNTVRNYAATLYNQHRLRDLETNGSDENFSPCKARHLFNVTDELRKYTLPIISGSRKKADIEKKIKLIEEGIIDVEKSGDFRKIKAGVDDLNGYFNSPDGGILDISAVLPADTDQVVIQKTKQPDQPYDKKAKTENLSTGETKTIPKSTPVKGKTAIGDASGGGGDFPPLPPQLMAIIGIIVLVIALLLFFRTCSGCSLGGGKGGNPSGNIITDQLPEPPQFSPVTSDPPSALPRITYGDIHFVRDTRFFLSEGNRYTNMQPILTEGKYEDRLNKIAQDIKSILAVVPDQIFVISGYAADIPGHTDGEMLLSTQRAERVKEILVSLGVPLKNLQCVYLGGTNQWGDNSSEETIKQNRVVTIEVKK